MWFLLANPDKALKRFIRDIALCLPIVLHWQVEDQSHMEDWLVQMLTFSAL